MTEALLKGFALGSVLALSVGPVIFTIIKQSINTGKQGGFSFVAGVWASDILLVLVTNVFSGWITEVLVYRQVIGFAGSFFLVAMGVFYVFFKKVTLKAATDTEEFRFGKDFVKLAVSGFFINTFNPNVIFFWLLNATAFAVSHTWKQRMVIFVTCLAINMGADTGKILLAEKVRQRLTLRNMTIINTISGTILIGFGVALCYSALFLSGKR